MCVCMYTMVIKAHSNPLPRYILFSGKALGLHTMNMCTYYVAKYNIMHTHVHLPTHLYRMYTKTSDELIMYT